MTDPNPIVDALLASGRRELTTTPTEDTAVIDAETPTDPIPADDQPHAYVVVQRTHSVNADRPEWAAAAYVISEHDHDEIAFARARGRTLLPIGPDGDTGTRAIVEPLKVTTVAELEALPIGSIAVIDGIAVQLLDNDWRATNAGGLRIAHAALLQVCGDLTLVHVPTGEADRDH